MIAFVSATCALLFGVGVADWRRTNALKLLFALLAVLGVFLLFVGQASQSTGCGQPPIEMLALAPWIATGGLALAALCAGFYGRVFVSGAYGAAAIGTLLLLAAAVPIGLMAGMGECPPP